MALGRAGVLLHGDVALVIVLIAAGRIRIRARVVCGNHLNASITKHV